jgi:biopolymer transport protein ExbD
MDMMDSDDMAETDKINVVPLAYLSLVLLIIMMLLSPVAMSSMIKVQAPRIDKVLSTPKNEKETPPDPLLIKITAEGLFLNNSKVDSEEFLGEQLAIKLQNDRDRPVIVSADDNIQVGDVVHILDLAKQSGAEKVSLLKGGKGS